MKPGNTYPPSARSRGRSGRPAPHEFFREGSFERPGGPARFGYRGIAFETDRRGSHRRPTGRSGQADFGPSRDGHRHAAWPGFERTYGDERHHFGYRDPSSDPTRRPRGGGRSHSESLNFRFGREQHVPRRYWPAGPRFDTRDARRFAFRPNFERTPGEERHPFRYRDLGSDPTCPSRGRGGYRDEGFRFGREQHGPHRRWPEDPRFDTRDARRFAFRPNFERTHGEERDRFRYRDLGSDVTRRPSGPGGYRDEGFRFDQEQSHTRRYWPEGPRFDTRDARRFAFRPNFERTHGEERHHFRYRDLGSDPTRRPGERGRYRDDAFRFGREQHGPHRRWPENPRFEGHERGGRKTHRGRRGEFRETREGDRARGSFGPRRFAGERAIRAHWRDAARHRADTGSVTFERRGVRGTFPAGRRWDFGRGQGYAETPREERGSRFRRPDAFLFFSQCFPMARHHKHHNRRLAGHERTHDMARMVANCPSCDGALEVRRLECPACGVSVDGHFESGPLARLNRDQLAFVEAFLRCRGKIKDVEVELGISYPTVVTRLNEVLVAMGFEAGEDPREAERRQKILDDLASGQISATEAAEKLRQMGG